MSKHTYRSITLSVLLLTGAVSAQPAPAEPMETHAEPPEDIQARYREVVARAIAEYELGHFGEARALFLQAHELWPSARTLRTLGMTAFELRMYPRALVELQAALDDRRRPLPAEQHSQVTQLIAQASAFVGRYRVRGIPEGGSLSVDGVTQERIEPLVLSVGEHSLVARAPGHGELRRQLVVQGREDEELDVTLTALAQPMAAAMPLAPRVAPAEPTPLAHSAPEPAHPYRTLAIVSYGVAAVGVIVGSVSGVIAFGHKGDADLEAGHRAADISTASFITAGVGAAAGTILLFVEPDDKEPARIAWSPLGVSGRF